MYHVPYPVPGEVLPFEDYNFHGFKIDFRNRYHDGVYWPVVALNPHTGVRAMYLDPEIIVVILKVIEFSLYI